MQNGPGHNMSMTLAVGIGYPDGVVIGMDSAVTFAAQATPTIMEISHEKIDIIENKVVVGCCGDAGFAQRFVGAVEKVWKGLENSSDSQAMGIVDVGCEILKVAKRNFAETNAKVYGRGALLAIPHRGKAELIEFPPDSLQPEVKNKDIRYVSIARMGSGQVIADPLLGMAQRALWANDLPSREEAIFATTMVLKLTCEMATREVAKPIHIATLAPDPDQMGELSARLLSSEELEEYKERVKRALKCFRDYARGLI